jgi:hypothetical protein
MCAHAQAALQLCLRASREANAAAEGFLESGCTALRRAYAFEDLLLSPVQPGSAPQGATILWRAAFLALKVPSCARCHENERCRQAIHASSFVGRCPSAQQVPYGAPCATHSPCSIMMCSVKATCPLASLGQQGQTPHLVLSVLLRWRRDDSEAAALPTVGFGQAVQREAAVKVVATRLQRSALYRPLLARAGLAADAAGAPAQQLYISLKPALRQGARMHASPCSLHAMLSRSHVNRALSTHSSHHLVMLTAPPLPAATQRLG